MVGTTHAAVGAALGVTLSVVTPHYTPLTLALVAGFAALLPDIDQPVSIIGRRAHVARYMHHRGITHSGIAWMVISFASLILLPLPVAVAIFVGYGSHLFLDSLNSTGIPLWYPNKRKFRLAKIKVGGFIDHGLALLALMELFAIIALR
ncbi:MAG TPA: metal-dependent hydrolase [Phototrophicaceae bacterium]|nr:metal-dependent hydrolase [Phototrophicaceae bacterium]